MSKPQLNFDPFKPTSRRHACPACDGGRLLIEPLGDRRKVFCDECEFSKLYKPPTPCVCCSLMTQGKSRGMCRKCHIRWIRHGKPADITAWFASLPKSTPPSKFVCVCCRKKGKKKSARNMCSGCYERWRREDKPETPSRPKPVKKKVIKKKKAARKTKPLPTPTPAPRRFKRTAVRLIHIKRIEFGLPLNAVLVSLKKGRLTLATDTGVIIRQIPLTELEQFDG